MFEFTSLNQLSSADRDFHQRKLNVLQRKFPLGKSVIRITIDDYGIDMYKGVITDYKICNMRTLVVACEFLIDCKRTMYFNSKGVNAMGLEYGAIKLSEEVTNCEVQDELI